MPKKQPQLRKKVASGKVVQLAQLAKDVTKKFKGRKLVFGQGNNNAELMIIGEVTEPEEEIKSKILLGASGKIFDQILKDHQLRRGNFYITNAVKFCHENKIPSPKEIKQCSVFLKQEIKIIEPKLIIALGSIALRGLGVKLPLANIRGRLIRFGDINLFATHHPSEVIRDPSLHMEIRSDFQKLKDLIQNLSSLVQEV